MKKIAILTIAIVMSVVLVSGCIGNDETNNPSINITNITNNIALNGEYYIGDVTGLLTLNQNIDYLYVTIEYYDNSNAQIGQSKIMLTENNVKEGQKFNLENEYYDEGEPSKAIIKIYDDMGTNILKQEEININI